MSPSSFLNNNMESQYIFSKKCHKVYEKEGEF